MAAYMYLGEYTTGCVCAPSKAHESQPTDEAKPQDAGAELDGVAAAQAVAAAYQDFYQDYQAGMIALGVVNVGATLLIIGNGSPNE